MLDAKFMSELINPLDEFFHKSLCFGNLFLEPRRIGS